MGEASPRRNNGAEDPLGELYRQFSQELWARLYAVCFDSHLAMDAVHEAFLRLRCADAIAVKETRAWLLQVGRNWLRDAARRRKRRREDDIEPYLVEGGLRDPLSTALAVEERARIRLALELLDTDDREALILRYALDWRSERMAEALGITAAAVDMRLCRARKRLALILKDSGVGHEAAKAR